MPEEAVCPTCRCTVVVTQQGTCPMGHPIDAAAVKAASPPAPAPAPAPAPEAAAPVAAAGAATAGAVAAGAGAADAPQQAPAPSAFEAQTIGDPFAAPGAQPPDPAVPTGDTSTLPPPGESDFLSGPAPEPTAAQKPKRKTSPVFVVLLVLILVLVVVAAVVVVFFPEMIGLAMAVPALAAVT